MEKWMVAAAGLFADNVVLSGLWKLCLSASAIIVFFLCIRPWMKRLPRIGMYLLWGMLVLRIAIPVPVTGIYKILPEKVEQEAARTTMQGEPAQIRQRLERQRLARYGGAKNGYRLTEAVERDENKNSQKTNISSQPVETTPQKSSDKQGDGMALAVVVIWIGGIVCCCCYLVCSLVANQKMFRHSTHVFDNVYEHSFGCSSFVGGILSPKIYVPKGMKEQDLEYILVHERIHIKRRDYLVKPTAFLVFSVLWFNPLVWVAYRLMMKDMEISCDEAVIRKLGSDARKRYSFLLLAMASGDNGILSPNAAFGTEVINERIHNVMKYKKPSKFVVAAVTFAVALCGCGISSTPEKTVSELPKVQQETDVVYVEQTMPELPADEMIEQLGYDPVKDDFTLMQEMTDVDANGTLAVIATLYHEPDLKKLTMLKCEYVDGAWQAGKVKWYDNLKKALEDKENLSIGTSSQYGVDGCLYLEYNQYSMPFEVYNQNVEKYKDDYYLVQNYLYKIDEETGEVSELPMPAEKQEDGGKNEIKYGSVSVLANGDYVLLSGNVFEVRSAVTGEKKNSLPFGENRQRMHMPYAGDDFVCWRETNKDTDEIEIYMCNADGSGLYKLPTGETFETDKGGARVANSIAMGVRENTVMLATSDGIFEADCGDDEFCKVVGDEKDNLYYLGSDNYYALGDVYISAQGEYYVTDLVKKGSADKFYWCSYTPKSQTD